MPPLDRDQVLGLLERVGHQDDGEIDLGDTALLLAALEQPDADLAFYRRHLEQLVTELAAEATGSSGSSGASDVARRLAALRTILYDRHDYDGDQETYDDLRNADLMHVIDRKKGLPVALGILCIHVAERVGWNISGLNFPSHFLLRLEMSSERAIIDPFDHCKSLDAVAIRARLKELLGEGAEFQPSYFEPVTKRAILLRLQNNIKLRALQTNDPDRAINVLEAMALIAPHGEALFVERAMLYANRGELTQAIKTLAGYLEREPTTDDHPEIQSLLKNLRANLN